MTLEFDRRMTCPGAVSQDLESARHVYLFFYWIGIHPCYNDWIFVGIPLIFTRFQGNSGISNNAGAKKILKETIWPRKSVLGKIFKKKNIWNYWAVNLDLFDLTFVLKVMPCLCPIPGMTWTLWCQPTVGRTRLAWPPGGTWVSRAVTPKWPPRSQFTATQWTLWTGRDSGKNKIIFPSSTEK